MDIPGVDVASYQGQPHPGWADEAGPFDWAAVKLTELSTAGPYTDPDAAADWAYLKEHGKGRIAYLFAHCDTDPKATVDLFTAEVNALGGLEPADGIAVDWETLDGMSPDVGASWMREVTADLGAAFGRPVIVYTDRDMASNGACEGLGGCYLWLADPDHPSGLPQVPIGPWKDWFAHQYSMAAPIDHDVAHFSTLAAMQAAMGKPVWERETKVWVATGEESLISLSRLLKCGISTILRLTCESAANGEFTEPFAGYIDEGNFNLPIPRGVRVTYYETVRV